jgi:Flp pilus assembly protein TadG
MTRFLPHRRSPHSNEAGAALVEFAFVLPVLLVLLLGMLDFGKAFNYWIDETHLANEAARWAVVNKNPGGGGVALQEYVRRQATTPELRDGGASVSSPLQVCISFPTDASDGTSAEVGDPVHVTATADYTWLAFISERLGIAQTTITGSATMRLEALPTNYGAGCS